MSFSTNLQTTEQTALPELYEFVSGAQTERYTSFASGLTFRGNFYKAAPLKRSGFSEDTQFGNVKVTITAPLFETLIHYLANQPIEPTRVTIYRALESDLSDYRILFSGFIKQVSMRDRLASAVCESNSQVLSAKIPTVIYQSFCNHSVFDSGCGLNNLDWRVMALISTVESATLTSTSFAAFDDGYFIGGQIRYDSDLRLITNHLDNTVTLQIPFDSRVKVGTTVEVFPGCDGSPTTCKNRFNNLTRFLGMPYIPSHNPVLWGFR